MGIRRRRNKLQSRVEECKAPLDRQSQIDWECRPYFKISKTGLGATRVPYRSKDGNARYVNGGGKAGRSLEGTITGGKSRKERGSHESGKRGVRPAWPGRVEITP